MSQVKTRLVTMSNAPAEEQRVAMVTGAAGGMGQAIVKRLHDAGMAIILVDLKGEPAVEFARECGCAGAVIEADLSVPQSAQEIMELVEQHIGRLDHLVNNAGANIPSNLFNIEVEQWDTVLAVNLRAPMLLTKYAIPFWKKQGGGAVVTIGSRVWVSGAIPAYTASKAGVVGLSRSFAVELAPLNVRANVVAPGYVDTAFTRQTRSEEFIEKMQANVVGITPLGRVGKAEDIASAVAFFLSDEASYITGEVLHVCGGSQLAARANQNAARMEGEGSK